MRRFVVLLALLCIPAAASAQKNCKKGIPCGGTCIAANKVCRIGSPASSRSTSSTREASASLPTAGAVAMGPWVASTKGHTYYRAGCAGAKKLSEKNRAYFKTEEDAQQAGYSRSTAKGC